MYGLSPNIFKLRKPLAYLALLMVKVKQFQWQYAWHLFMHQTSIFLMMPCGSGKTYIYIALSIILWFASLNAKKSNRVIIVYAPLNEIIRGQIELVRSMHGTSEGTRYCCVTFSDENASWDESPSCIAFTPATNKSCLSFLFCRFYSLLFFPVSF